MMKESGDKYILYADDDREDQNMLRDVLNDMRTDVELVTVTDGVEAVNFLKDLESGWKYPCLIILDINMPKLNGIDTLKKLKNDLALDLPVIIFSTAVNELTKHMAKALGADDCVKKPVTLDSFRQVASRFIHACEPDSAVK
jgi:CheY-like chemotaxis protein